MHQMAGGGVDWKAIREDFPILCERAHGQPLIYFDSAATSQKPQTVLDALRNYYEHNNANVHRGLHELSSRATEAYETSRQHVAKYIGAATADEIIFTRGPTEGINLVAQAWRGKFLRDGDVILLTEMEHHSNVVPWHGGGEMIVSVTLEKSVFKKAPHRFEAGTPNIAGAIGLGAAIKYIEGIGRAAIFEHDGRLAEYAMERLAELPGMRVLGPSGQRGALVGFVMDSAHPHDLTTFADQHGLALRGGHHCNQPLMRRFGLPGTTRASFYFYNTIDEIDRMIEILRAAAG